ncbi:epoxide hydrolase [Tyrophagus putrescentiae]|nr:epoxide hydrolase [Tyrophagus putrescentiae]
MFATLMKDRLGFSKYFLQGNDWGSIITRNIAILYPENVIGIHVLGLFDPLENLLNAKRLARNILYPHIPDLDPVQWKRDYDKLFPLKQTLLEAFEETGVMHLMMTKPDTLSSALVDTPTGMAAHILEKLSSFTNKANRAMDDGGLELKYTKDQLITLVMIYYTTPSVAATARLYKEFILSNSTVTSEVIQVPAGLVDTEHEMIRSPKALAEANYAKLVQYSDLRDGGHLMFFEEPKMIVDDLRLFVHKVVDSGSDGSLLDKIKDRLPIIG